MNIWSIFVFKKEFDTSNVGIRMRQPFMFLSQILTGGYGFFSLPNRKIYFRHRANESNILPILNHEIMHMLLLKRIGMNACVGLDAINGSGDFFEVIGQGGVGLLTFLSMEGLHE